METLLGEQDRRRLRALPRPEEKEELPIPLQAAVEGAGALQPLPWHGGCPAPPSTAGTVLVLSPLPCHRPCTPQGDRWRHPRTAGGDTPRTEHSPRCTPCPQDSHTRAQHSRGQGMGQRCRSC